MIDIIYIINITNTHELWNGRFITCTQLDELTKVLQLTDYRHTITYETESGKEVVRFI
jgi:hypothetical protein